MPEDVAAQPVRVALAAAMLAIAAAAPVQAIVRHAPDTPLRQKQFARPDLYISSANAPLAEVIERLPNRAAWDAFASSRAADGSPFAVFIDPRSGTATNIMGAVPLIPGRGVGNRVSLEALGQALGRRLDVVDSAAVGGAVSAFIHEHHDVLGLDASQLGAVRATPITEDLWQVSIPQQYQGIPVRYGRVAASISHGNLVTIGTATWGNVALPDVTPSLSREAALEVGFAYVDGRVPTDRVLSGPALEILPFARADGQSGRVFTGAIGTGYGHRLVWTFSFRRRSDPGTFEVIVDARSGEVIAFHDIDRYVQRQVTGGVYPLANTETCPTPQTCGEMQLGWPMPFADTGLPAPNNFTNSAGVYDYPGGTSATTLSGRFARTFDYCGPVSASAADGAINLGGANGDHDCPGAFNGNRAAARTSFYEVNKIAEIARGYLPNNAWVRGLVGPLPVSTDENQSCNASYTGKFNAGDPGSLHFLRSSVDPVGGDLCRNTGEIAEVADHEWGHGLDDHDANSAFSFSSEAYGDIAALYRNQTSCLGYGFFRSSIDSACAPTSDGPNVDEAQAGPTYCTTECSGVRDADFARHIPATPATVLDFVCNQCAEPLPGEHVGPCGLEAHCDAAPARQAAWDLVARELPAAPFGYDSQTAFILANKLFYQGSGNIGNWYSCACGGSAGGCAADNAYIQWLTADDDNGNLNDGTPHATAVFNAFDRHGMSCRSIPHSNSGCPTGPGVAPTLNGTPGGFRVSATWNAIPGATRYWVYRTEGHAGCDYGKALIAQVTGLSFTDTEVAAGRPYSYNVVAAGASSACFSRASNCVTVVPDVVDYRVACAPSFANTAPTTCTVTSLSDFSSPVTLGCADLPGTASCSFTPATVTPPRNGSASTTLTMSPGVTPPGVYVLRVRGSLPSTPNADNSGIVQWTLTDASGGTGNVATYDPAARAPKCRIAGRSCDTGPSLVRGRGTLTPEPNQPNTTTSGPFEPTCLDGSGVPFPGLRAYGSNDRIMVYTVDGSPLAAGKLVRVDAMVSPTDVLSDDTVDFFAASDSASGWVFIGSRVPTTRVPQMLSVTYTLPAGRQHAVRVQFRYKGTRTTCTTGPYNDHDDVVFTVN